MNASPAPGTPQTGTKAQIASVLTVIVAFTLLWIADEDPFTAKEIASAAIKALVGAGVVGLPTYLTRNKPTA